MVPSSSSNYPFADLPTLHLSRAPSLIPIKSGVRLCSLSSPELFPFSSSTGYIMELKTINDAFDHVTKKQKLHSSRSDEAIEQISKEIEQVLVKLQSGDASCSQYDHKTILSELKTKLKEIAPLGQVEGTQKELNVALSKYAKQLEKFFHTDISKAYRNVDFDSQTVNQVIAGHLYRQGLFDMGDCFKDEAGEQEAAALKSPFTEMYYILEAIKSRNLEPALNWVVKNHEQLRGSDLEFKLHSLQYVEIMLKGKDDPLQYAKTYLSPFSSTHSAEFHRLMGSLLYARKLDSSPYVELLSASNWEKLAEELARHFCDLLGLSFESPLNVTVAAGVQGLPTLLKLMNVNVMTGKKQEWQTMKQLPVPIDLGREFQFHSVFVCPVSRDQATEENPPMLMTCGHVLCKQSIMKLSKSSTKSFKCPYCPYEIDAPQCKQLYF